MSASIGKDKLDFDITEPAQSDNIGAFVRAGDDGALITHHTNYVTDAASVLFQGIVFTANTAGSVGNSIALVFNGTDDVATVVSAWNLANPANTVAFTGLGTVVPTAGTAQLANGSDVNNALDVWVINPDLTKIASALYAEDSVHVSGDLGNFALAVRHDADTSMVSNDGDYAPLQVDATGRLKVDATFATSFDFVYPEDQAAADADPGAYVLTVRQDTPAVTTSNDGDFQSFKTDNVGRLWTHSIIDGDVADDAADAGNPIKVGTRSEWGALAAISANNDRADLISDKYRRLYVNNGANVAAASAAVSVTSAGVNLVTAGNLAGRRQILIQNLGNRAIYVGPSGVSITSGIRIAANANVTLEVGQDINLFGITDTTAQDVRVLELA